MRRSMTADSDRKLFGSFVTPRARSGMISKIRLKKLSIAPNLKLPSLESDGLASPYEWGLANRQYKKVYPNRINTLWYRRYVNKLPEEERIDFQPFTEVQKVDEDIALQYFYGEDGHIERGPIDQNVVERRRIALQKYNTHKEQEERDKAMQEEESKKLGVSRYASVMRVLKEREKSDFGATAAERKVITPLITFMLKMTMKKRRQVQLVTLKKGSKWRLLKTPVISRKLHLMYLNLRKDQCQARFRKIINLVICSMRFIISIRIIARSTKQILKELEIFQARTRTVYSNNSLQDKKRVFDPSKYTFKEMFIPFETMLTLTKPWFVRNDKEIDKVVAVLQSYKSFVQYPPAFQRRLASVAWYIEIEANKYIIRQRHIACDFYVLLRGRAMEVRLFGDPYIKAHGEMRVTRYLKKSEGFGDESMSDPECQRDYSIISCEPCALLAISVYDYNVMLHTKKDDETAPEHIIFLRWTLIAETEMRIHPCCTKKDHENAPEHTKFTDHLGLMEDFPKKKLLEEGDDNISIHYFRQESVITKSLKTSNFVFVVINSAMKSKSPQTQSFSLEQEKFKQEVSQTVKGDMLRLQLRARKNRKDSAAANFHQSLADDIADLDHKSKEILKTLPREVRATFNVRNFSKLAEKSLPMKESVESRHGPMSAAMQTSVANLTTSLSLDMWTALLGEQLVTVNEKNLGEVIVEEDYGGGGAETPNGRLLSPQFVSSMSLSSLISEVKTDGIKTPFASARESLEVENQTPGQVTSVKDTKLPPTKETEVKRTKLPPTKEIQVKRTKLTPKKETKVKHTKLTPKRDSIKFEDSKPKTSDAAQHRKKSLRTKRDSKTLDKKYCSRWRHIRYMTRGDYVGQEWLDFNKGPFDPPKETWSLVSDGCEVVMIKKSFLLKYMQREW